MRVCLWVGVCGCVPVYVLEVKLDLKDNQFVLRFCPDEVIEFQ